jgi:hypothetical protein
MIKHGYSPTAGDFTAVSSFVEPPFNRAERCDYKTDDEVTLEGLDLLMDADLPINGLHIATNNGVIRVMGRVPHKGVDREIETLLRSIRGAIDVIVDIRVDESLAVTEKAERE